MNVARWLWRNFEAMWGGVKTVADETPWVITWVLFLVLIFVTVRSGR